MNEIANRLNTYIQSHPFDAGDSGCETVLDQLYQAYAESHESVLRRLVMDSRSWRDFYTPCRWMITTPCSTSAAACAVPTNVRLSAMASSMVRI